MQDYVVLITLTAVILAVYAGKNFIAGLQFLFGDIKRPSRASMIVELGEGHCLILTQHQDLAAYNRLLRLKDGTETILPVFFGEIEQCVSDTLARLGSLQENTSKSLSIEVRGAIYQFKTQHIPGQGVITYRQRKMQDQADELPPILGDLQQAVTETIKPLAGTTTDLFKLPTFSVVLGSKTYAFDARHLRGEEFVIARSVQDMHKTPRLLPPMTGTIGDVIADTLTQNNRTTRRTSADGLQPVHATTLPQQESLRGPDKARINGPKIFVEYSGQVVKAGIGPSGRGYDHFIVHLRTADRNTIEFTGNDLASKHNKEFALGDYITIKQINEPDPNSQDLNRKKKLFAIVCNKKAAVTTGEEQKWAPEI
jgi:hypothetical protein